MCNSSYTHDRKSGAGPLPWLRAAIFVSVCLSAATASLASVRFSDLVDFHQTTGYNPYSQLIQGFDGKLYGTTSEGGAQNAGTVFKVSSTGRLFTLYSFCSLPGCADGRFPQTALVQGSDGDFYGVTQAGGANDDGTIFKINKRGKLTTLYSFCSLSKCADGSAPYGPLVENADGEFLGTTSADGAQNGGTVFKISRRGVLTTLHSFCSKSKCADGNSPTHGLLLADDGNFYGTTGEGGAAGVGTVFKITPTGKLTTLYSFCPQTGCTDGDYPYAGLIQATDGNLYGTTVFGGTQGGGSVFKLTLEGKLTTLYSFCIQAACADGEHPYAGLVQGTSGNFYGITTEGGATLKPPKIFGTYGTIFKITPRGKFTTLYDFCSQASCADGEFPYGELIQATDGRFYGTTLYGGDLSCTMGCGTIYRMAAGLGPFVQTQPRSGAVGAAVVIQGTNLQGATSVTFNGTAANFTVISGAEIKTTVPEGATTGRVEVTTPEGTLSSNVLFRVINNQSR